MRLPPRWAFKLAGAVALLAVAAGVAAPYLDAGAYGERLRVSLERALGGNRRVELGRVHFNLFKGPGFSVDGVIVHEDPAIGAEPVVYILPDSGSLEVAPNLWSLLGGRFVIASIRLTGASINLSKSGPASEWGQWNFASFVNRSALSAVPAIRVRDSRVNVKFGDAKSVVYLRQADLDITPPTRAGAGWSVACSAQAARTDRTAQGLAAFTLRGRWYLRPERVDLDLDLKQAGLGQITALFRGQTGAVHGSLSAHLHLAGPLDNIGVSGRLSVEDVHRWDMLPTQGKGWTLDIGGRLDLLAQRIDLESMSARGAPLPLALRFQADGYLSQPHWSAALYWNQYPIGPILELARHLGARIAPGLKLSGSMDGELDYADRSGFEGRIALRDASLTIPGSPPVGFDQAGVVIGQGHARLTPAVVRTPDGEEARIEADYDSGQSRLDLSISAETMKVASLRAQVALAAVPWLEQLSAGTWGGWLRYHADPATAGWTGRLELSDAELPVPGLADPLRLASARVRIEGARVAIDRAEARAGNLAFSAEYSYEPGAARPHRLRLTAPEVNAEDLERELMPTLRRAGLIGQALGRAPLPAWLEGRRVDGTIEIADLALAGSRWTQVRSHMQWDAARVEFSGVQAKLGPAALAGALTVNLRGTRPAYQLKAAAKGVPWQTGKVNAEGEVETFGFGAQLLANLTAAGSFTATGVDLGLPSPCRAASGDFAADWPHGGLRLRFANLAIRAENEDFTGSGGSGEDGKIAIALAGATKTLKLGGTLERLKAEEPAR